MVSVQGRMRRGSDFGSGGGYGRGGGFGSGNGFGRGRGGPRGGRGGFEGGYGGGGYGGYGGEGEGYGGGRGGYGGESAGYGGYGGEHDGYGEQGGYGGGGGGYGGGSGGYAGGGGYERGGYGGGRGGYGGEAPGFGGEGGYGVGMAGSSMRGPDPPLPAHPPAYPAPAGEANGAPPVPGVTPPVAVDPSAIDTGNAYDKAIAAFINGTQGTGYGYEPPPKFGRGGAHTLGRGNNGTSGTRGAIASYNRGGYIRGVRHRMDKNELARLGKEVERRCSAVLPPQQRMATIPEVSEGPVFRLFFVLKGAVSTPQPDHITDMFNRFGHLFNAHLMSDKNFGYARYTDEESAKTAAENLNGATLNQGVLKVGHLDSK